MRSYLVSIVLPALAAAAPFEGGLAERGLSTNACRKFNEEVDHCSGAYDYCQSLVGGWSATSTIVLTSTYFTQVEATPTAELSSTTTMTEYIYTAPAACYAAGVDKRHTSKTTTRVVKPTTTTAGAPSTTTTKHSKVTHTTDATTATPTITRSFQPVPTCLTTKAAAQMSAECSCLFVGGTLTVTSTSYTTLPTTVSAPAPIGSKASSKATVTTVTTTATVSSFQVVATGQWNLDPPYGRSYLQIEGETTANPYFNLLPQPLYPAGSCSGYNFIIDEYCRLASASTSQFAFGGYSLPVILGEPGIPVPFNYTNIYCRVDASSEVLSCYTPYGVSQSNMCVRSQYGSDAWFMGPWPSYCYNGEEFGLAIAEPCEDYPPPPSTPIQSSSPQASDLPE